MTKLKLTEIDADKKCKVVEFNGGSNMKTKLENLGIRIGNEITVNNNSFMGGPITVMAGSTKVAIGRKMAERIIVEVTK
ncbi:MAG: FeoA family protein [Bacillota bacterium]|nr:FeoA family protein [Bacillota bacterium]